MMRGKARGPPQRQKVAAATREGGAPGYRSGFDFEHAVQGNARPVLDVATNLDPVYDAAFHQVFESPGKMLGADAIHGGAQAAVFFERDDLLALRGETLREPVDQVNLGTDG